MLSGKTVIVGVSGSIAAYKAASLVSMLVKAHADVRVIMTKNACNISIRLHLKRFRDTNAWLILLTGILNSR